MCSLDMRDRGRERWWERVEQKGGACKKKTKKNPQHLDHLTLLSVAGPEPFIRGSSVRLTREARECFLRNAEASDRAWRKGKHTALYRNTLKNK